MKTIYLTIIFIVTLTACNPVSAPIVVTKSTGTPSAASTPVSLTPTASPTTTPDYIATLGTYPTFLPGPTSTALPTLPPGRSLSLAGIHMIDEQNGWGIDTGEHIVRTADGGNTWEDVTPHNGGYQNSGFFALDARTAWATPHQEPCFPYNEKCDFGPNLATIWHTTDGGKTWQEQHACLWISRECQFQFDLPPEYYYPIALRFLDTQTGWLLVTVAHVMNQDRYILFHTQDGGAHWSFATNNVLGPPTTSATGLAFQDRQTGWMSFYSTGISSDSPLVDWGIYQSTDAGVTWDELPPPTPNPFPEPSVSNMVECDGTGITAIPPNAVGATVECTVYTNSSSFPPTYFYFYSTDSGKHWLYWQKTGDVQLIDPSVGWRSTLDNGAYDLEQTQDGGKTWTKLKTVAWNGTFDFINEQTGWAIATNDKIVALVHTSDGGKTWEEMKPVVTTP